MNIISTIPITRNKFQKPAFFYSDKKFDVGSVIFIPHPPKSSKKNGRAKLEKPAIVIEIDKLKNKKSFIRRNKIDIKKITNEKQISLFEQETIDLILLAKQKINYSIQEILQKITPTKIIKKINNLNPVDVGRLQDMQEFFKKIDKKYIIKKLQPKKSGSSEGPQKTSLKSISSIISLEEQKQKKSSLYSEKHYLVDEIRNYFGETAKKGKGSFPFYLGFFKRIPKATIYQYWSEVKESRKPIKDQQKLFWWKIGKHVRESKTKK